MSALNFDFAQLSANGSTDIINIPVDGDYAFYVHGTFGGGTAAIEVTLDGTLWFTLSTATSNARAVHKLTSNEKVRITLTGSAAPTLDSGVR